MQVHAVPDSERVQDSTGRRLPWGFEFADAEPSKRRIPEERGPFGRARKRGASRSKTATPASEVSRAKLENQRVIDDIFTFAKVQEGQKESLRLRNTSGASALPVSASAPNLLEAAGGLGGSLLGNGSSTNNNKEPTEVMLYGYGSDVQWAAIDYYEKVSSGIIYEEYDRQPPNARFDFSLSQQKASSFRALSRSSIREINKYIGGDHWIKVTFDSPEAAERACHYSPHIIQGYLVHAQRYLGRGPNEDAAIRAEPGSRITSTTASPKAAASSHTLPWGQSSSTTLSSATATTSRPASLPQRMASEPFFRTSGAFVDDDQTIVPTEPAQPPVRTAAAATSSSVQAQPGRSTLRVRGAKPAVLLPPEKAFLPTASPWQKTLGSWPVIGWIIGPDHGIIGDHVPRKEDGSFDSANASLYWRVWYNVDACFGTDFCGVRDTEIDE